MNKFKRIGAIIIIILLLLLYLVCFIAAISGGEQAQLIFRVTLGLTVALPVLLYIFILLLKLAKDRDARAAGKLPQPGDLPLPEPAREDLPSGSGESGEKK